MPGNTNDLARQYDPEDMEDFVTHNLAFIGWLCNWLCKPSLANTVADTGCGVTYDY